MGEGVVVDLVELQAGVGEIAGGQAHVRATGEGVEIGGAVALQHTCGFGVGPGLDLAGQRADAAAFGAILVGVAFGFVAVPTCVVCGEHSFMRYRDPADWWLLFAGLDTGNGSGNAITAERAARLAAAFAVPYAYERVRGGGFHDDAGFCGACGKPYCRRHWHVSGSGYGHCPHGHGKSLDPRPTTEMPYSAFAGGVV